MNKVLVLLILASTLSLQAQAQINGAPGSLKQYRTQNPNSTEIKKVEGINLENFSTLPWKTDERFTILSTDEKGLPVSLEGTVDQGRSASWEAKAQTWLDATAEVMLQDDKTEFVKEKLWTDALGQTHLKMDQYHDLSLIHI